MKKNPLEFKNRGTEIDNLRCKKNRIGTTNTE
jgi:hypothetical protein